MSTISHQEAWQPLAAAPDIAIEPRSLLVHFQDGRRHRLRVTEAEHGWRLTGLIVRNAAQNYSSSPMLTAALRNRQIRLASLLVNDEGHLVGEVLIPRAGITAGEFQTLARHLATECDRLEFMLTGTDREAR